MSLSERLTANFIELNLNGEVMKFYPTHDIERKAVRGLGQNSQFICMRQEIQRLKELSLQERRENMKRLFINDFVLEKKEMRKIGLGFITTQP